jgi:hypothetical protein
MKKHPKVHFYSIILFPDASVALGIADKHRANQDNNTT